MKRKTKTRRNMLTHSYRDGKSIKDFQDSDTSKIRSSSTTWGILSEVDYLLSHSPQWKKVDWKSEKERRSYLDNYVRQGKQYIKPKANPKKRFNISYA